MVIINSHEEAMSYIKGEYERVASLAKEEVPKVMKVEPCKFQLTWGTHHLEIKTYYNGSKPPETTEQFNNQLAKYLTSLDAEKKRLLAVHEANLPAIENNKKVRAKVTQVMQAIGIPNSYSERDYSSKARTPKYNTKSAGYLSDLARNVTDTDGYDSAVQSANYAAQQATDYVRHAVALLGQKEREAAIAEQKRKNEMVIVHMRVKYECEPEASPRAVLDAILDKNKYLRLAHYLELNRGDWSEGSDYAEQGLYGFSIETPLDQEIYDVNKALCDDWEGDGRVFRDNEHNYSTIFALVEDDKLMKDYQTVKEMIEW